MLEYKIYLDLVWISNWYINLILLIWVRFWRCIKNAKRKIILGSFIGGTGGTYSLFFLLNNLHNLAKWEYWICQIGIMFSCLTIMFRVSFGKETLKQRIKEFLIYYLGAFIFAGFLSFSMVQRNTLAIESVNILSVSALELFIKGIIFVGILPWLSWLFQRCKMDVTHFCKIELEKNGRIRSGTALIDTGNCLRSVFTNEAVTVVEYEFIKNLLLESEQKQIESLFQWDTQEEWSTQVMYIPYHSLGEKNGMLLGIYVDNLRIYHENKRKDNPTALIGIYQKKLSINSDYQVILHVDCL